MANALSRPPITSPDAAPSSQATDAAARVFAGLVARQRRDDDFRTVYPAGRGPTLDEQAALTRRAASLGGWIETRLAGDDSSIAEFWERLDALKGRRLDDDQKAADLDNLMMALDGASRAALTQAMVQILQGRAGIDPRFSPTPPQIRGLADRIEQTWALEKRSIEAALAVPEQRPAVEAVLSPKERAALDERLAAIRTRIADRGRASSRAAPKLGPQRADAPRDRSAIEAVLAECEARRRDRKAGLGVPLPGACRA